MPKIIEPCAPTARRTEEGRELRKHGIEAFKFKSLAPRGYFKGSAQNIAPAPTTAKWQDNNFLLLEWRIRKLTPRVHKPVAVQLSLF